MVKKYIIFDFDGTIINTNNIITDSWQATLEHYLGHRLPVRDIESTFGEVIYDSMARLIPDADCNEAVEYYRAYQDANQSKSDVYIFDGIADMLRELRERGCVIGVGTSRTANSFWKYMKRFGMEELVDEVVTVNDVTRHKPDPETVDAVLLKMMAHDSEAWDAAETGENGDIVIPDAVREAAIMIGDSKYDVGCAGNARVDSVLVGWSHYIDEDDLRASGFMPTYRIETPADLLDLI